MHELSIAMSIIDMAEEEAAERGSPRIVAVHMRLGLLTSVVKEALLTSFQVASEGTSLEGSRLVIEEVPVEIFCSKCNRRHTIRSLQWFRCPECQSPAAKILQGKEMEVVALEIEE